MTANVCEGADCHQKSIKMFWREGCKYCELLKPQVEEMKAEHPEIDISIIDDTVNYKAGKGYKSYPTTVGYDEKGQQLREIVGCPPSNAKEFVLTALNQKTIADLAVMELVKERDKRIFELNAIELELSKRK